MTDTQAKIVRGPNDCRSYQKCSDDERLLDLRIRGQRLFLATL